MDSIDKILEAVEETTVQIVNLENEVRKFKKLLREHHRERFMHDEKYLDSEIYNKTVDALSE